MTSATATFLLAVTSRSPLTKGDISSITLASASGQLSASTMKRSVTFFTVPSSVILSYLAAVSM